MPVSDVLSLAHARFWSTAADFWAQGTGWGVRGRQGLPEERCCHVTAGRSPQLGTGAEMR